jgi:hypothetical protein
VTEKGLFPQLDLALRVGPRDILGELLRPLSIPEVAALC